MIDALTFYAVAAVAVLLAVLVAVLSVVTRRANRRRDQAVQHAENCEQVVDALLDQQDQRNLLDVTSLVPRDVKVDGIVHVLEHDDGTVDTLLERAERYGDELDPR